MVLDPTKYELPYSLYFISILGRDLPVHVLHTFGPIPCRAAAPKLGIGILSTSFSYSVHTRVPKFYYWYMYACITYSDRSSFFMCTRIGTPIGYRSSYYCPQKVLFVSILATIGSYR